MSQLREILRATDKQKSAQKLKEFCLKYARKNEGRKLSAADDCDIESFLFSLCNPANLKNAIVPEIFEGFLVYIAAGDNVEEYAKKVKEFDDAVMCGFVWSQDYLAYRCRTCARALSMALCSTCFLAADHTGHDFNMFRSLAGGACDCGDAQALKESGFCPKHSANVDKSERKAPDELFCTFDIIVPHIVKCLLLIFSSPDNYEGVSHYEFRSDYMTKCREKYKSAIKRPESICTEEDSAYLNCPLLCSKLNHVTYLDELMFWLVKLKLPESLLKFMLSLLPCKDYRTPFVDAFAHHYTRMMKLLTEDNGGGLENGEIIRNRMVYLSVQLLSNDFTALYLADEHKFLRVLVGSLYNILEECVTMGTFSDTSDNEHFVVDCRCRLMEDRCYWVAAHDLRNALSHKQVALLFLKDPLALELWCDLISFLQGMFPNTREVAGHVEHEDRAYYAAFTAELEVSASVAHSLLGHLEDESSFGCILSVLQSAVSQIQDWFDLIEFGPHLCWKPPLLQCCFHIPLHRLYSSFLWRALKLNAPVSFPPETFLLQLIMHPLCIQEFKRIGDNAYFIRQILDKIYATDKPCRKNIDEFCACLNKSVDKKDIRQKETFAKKLKSAKERQQRLMAQFTSKQKSLFNKFMQKEAAAQALNNRDQQGPDQGQTSSKNANGQSTTQKSAAVILQLPESEYERDDYRTVQCVIYSCSASINNDECPVGLVVSLQSTRVVSMQMAGDIDFCSKDENFDENFDKFYHANTRRDFESNRFERLKERYSTTDAHQRRNMYLQIDKGEFHCPVCRRFSNAVLPVYPDWSSKNDDPHAEKPIFGFSTRRQPTTKKILSRDEKLCAEIGVEYLVRM